MITVIDADSLCYGAGHSGDIKEAEFSFDNYIKRITNDTQCERFIAFVEAIDGKNIFRNHVAVTRPYKSNRAGRESPQFKDEMKRYAHSKWGIQYCYFIESEDAVTITAERIGLDKCIKSCCDKDMLTAPGIFHNYFGTEWKSPYYTQCEDPRFITVSEEQALRNLYYQMLRGDTDDAIDGIVGCGPKTAKPIIDEATVDDLPFVVAKHYKTAHENYKRVTEPLNYAYYIEQARLLKILRHRQEVFTPLTKEQYDEL